MATDRLNYRANDNVKLPAAPSQTTMSPHRRRLVLALGLSTLSPAAWSAGAELPLASSLPEHLAAALKQGDPLVVMVSLRGCPFCKVARENYLAPLLRAEKLPVIQVDMQSPQVLRNVLGAATTHQQQVRAWGVRVAPTVLFLGRGGVEIAKRLVGASLPDFYGAYLEESLLVARKTLA